MSPRSQAGPAPQTTTIIVNVTDRFSPSVRVGMSLADRTRSNLDLFKRYWRDRFDTHELEWVLADVSQYDALLRRYTGKALSEARVFEIGYGHAPYRLQAIQATGADVYGVDAEVPLLAGKPGEYLNIIRRNGWERFLKTAVRRLVFDRRRDAAFTRLLRDRGLSAGPIDADRLLVGDAAECNPPGPFDLIYSSVVFEHIERPTLSRLVARMPEWLTQDGIALIVPDVFTGLHGGHLYEWDGQTLGQNVHRRSEPWEHLRKRRYTANTTLNEMTRDEYAQLFARSFEILDIIDPPRGAEQQFLTADIRQELSMYSEADLLDENPLFVLRARRTAQAE
jgi:hypothetical protein